MQEELDSYVRFSLMRPTPLRSASACVDSKDKPARECGVEIGGADSQGWRRGEAGADDALLDKRLEGWQQKSGRVIPELLETELPELKSEDIIMLVWGPLGLQ